MPAAFSQLNACLDLLRTLAPPDIVLAGVQPGVSHLELARLRWERGHVFETQVLNAEDVEWARRIGTEQLATLMRDEMAVVVAVLEKRFAETPAPA